MTYLPAAMSTETGAKTDNRPRAPGRGSADVAEGTWTTDAVNVGDGPAGVTATGAGASGRCAGFGTPSLPEPCATCHTAAPASRAIDEPRGDPATATWRPVLGPALQNALHGHPLIGRSDAVPADQVASPAPILLAGRCSSATI